MRTPPSEAWLLVVEYAQWWKNATTKSMPGAMFGLVRESLSVCSIHVSWAPFEYPVLVWIS